MKNKESLANSAKGRQQSPKKELVFEFHYPKLSVFWKITIAIISFILLVLISLFIYLWIKTRQVIKVFTETAGITQEELITTTSNLYQHFQNSSQNLDNLPQEQRFLLLGTDQVYGREGLPELTDSILLLKTEAQSEKLTLLSLPRDLYSDAYQTKINALYQYGEERYPGEAQRFSEEVLEEMTGQDIDKTIAININDFEKLINLLGAIQIDVPRAFSDDEFPREGVDVSTVTDPELLYESIHFEAGEQEMTGKQALQYMRSRHAQGDEGTDLARSQRQQLVLEAILVKMKENISLTEFAQLYRFYLDHLQKYISLEEVMDILLPFIIKGNEIILPNIEFSALTLPIYPDEQDGIIYNPPLWKTKNLWIYQIRDLEQFKLFFSENF